MPFVIDTSVAACWCFPDESSDLANAALEALSETDGLVPNLFWLEIRNVLLMGEKRKRIDSENVQRGLAEIDLLPIVVDDDCVEDVLMTLARRHDLTAYDAAYVEVAFRNGVPLATLDKKMMRAAEAEGIPLLAA